MHVRSRRTLSVLWIVGVVACGGVVDLQEAPEAGAGALPRPFDAAGVDARLPEGDAPGGVDAASAPDSGAAADARADTGTPADAGTDTGSLVASPIPASLLGRIGRLTIRCSRKRTAVSSLHCNTYSSSRTFVCDGQVDMVGAGVQLTISGNCTVATGTSTCTAVYGSTNCGANCACPMNHGLSEPGTPATPTAPPALFDRPFTSRVITVGPTPTAEWVSACAPDGAQAPVCPTPPLGPPQGGLAAVDRLGVNGNKLEFSYLYASTPSCGGTSFRTGGYRGTSGPLFLDAEQCSATFE